MTASALPPLRVPRRAEPWWVRLLADARSLFLFQVMAASPHGASSAAPAPVEPTPADLEALMVDHAQAAYRVAPSIVRDHDLAEDVTQDAMMKAWLALPRFRGDAPLRNWVLRITHNTAISALRSRRTVVLDPDDLPEQAAPRSTEHDAHGKLMMEAFSTALDDLDELSRSIVVLREIEQLSYEEITEILDVALPTVKTRLLRARRVLANSLEGWRP